MTTETIMPPAHPGEILLEEFLDPLNVSQYQLAQDTRVRLGGSTRSCMASAVSAPAPGCAWRATSVLRSGSGSTCRLVTTWRSEGSPGRGS